MFKGMHISYDPETDILNVELGDVRARRAPGCVVWSYPTNNSTQVIFDVTDEEIPLSLEILNASKKYPQVDLDLLPREFPVHGDDLGDEHFTQGDDPEFDLQCAKWADLEDLKVWKSEFEDGFASGIEKTGMIGSFAEDHARWERCGLPSAEAGYMSALYAFRRRWNVEPDFESHVPNFDERWAMKEELRIAKMTPEEIEREALCKAIDETRSSDQSMARGKEFKLRRLKQLIAWAESQGLDIASLPENNSESGLDNGGFW